MSTNGNGIKRTLYAETQLDGDRSQHIEALIRAAHFTGQVVLNCSQGTVCSSVWKERTGDVGVTTVTNVLDKGKGS